MIGGGIYRIVNIVNGKIYVGSAVNFSRRWNDHRRQLNAGTHVNRLLQQAWAKYGSDAFMFEVIEHVERRGDLVLREGHWIRILDAALRGIGYNLCPTAGSMLGLKMSEETRRKMSAARIGRKKSPEHQAKINAALTGRRLSDEHKARLSLARSGTSATEEQKARMRIAQQNRTISEDARERMVSANIGRKFSAEHKERISLALKGKPKSESHKDKLRTAALNRAKKDDSDHA